MCVAPSAFLSSHVYRREVQRICPVFCFLSGLSRAQPGICREAACVPICPLRQAGRQVGAQAALWGRTPQAGWAQVWLWLTRDVLVLSLCQAFPSCLSVPCAQCGASAQHCTHLSWNIHLAPTPLTQCAGAPSDSKCFRVCAGARDYFINLRYFGKHSTFFKKEKKKNLVFYFIFCVNMRIFISRLVFGSL